MPKEGQIELRAINDDPASCDVTVKAFAVRMDGTLRELGTGAATVGAAACTLQILAQSVLASDEMLYFKWTATNGNSGSDIFAPRPYKDYDLQPSGLTAEINGNQITLGAKSLALFVAVEADVSGRFDQNAFTLLPDQHVTVTFVPTNPEDTPTFILRDLHSTTYA